MNEGTPRLFSLAGARAGKVPDGAVGTVMDSLWKLVEQPVEKLLSLDAMNDLYLRTLDLDQTGASYFASILEVMKIGYEVSDEDRKKIPASGPVIIVANHPFGAAEGVVLGDLLTRVRPDARLMGNHLLHRVPELRPSIIPVDPF